MLGLYKIRTMKILKRSTGKIEKRNKNHPELTREDRTI